MAYYLTQGATRVPRTAAWYLKPEATFSDALACVRRALWAAKYVEHSRGPDDTVRFHRQDWDTLLDQLASTA